MDIAKLKKEILQKRRSEYKQQNGQYRFKKKKVTFRQMLKYTDAKKQKKKITAKVLTKS